MRCCQYRCDLAIPFLYPCLGLLEMMLLSQVHAQAIVHTLQNPFPFRLVGGFDLLDPLLC